MKQWVTRFGCKFRSTWSVGSWRSQGVIVREINVGGEEVKARHTLFVSFINELFLCLFASLLDYHTLFNDQGEIDGEGGRK